MAHSNEQEFITFVNYHSSYGMVVPQKLYRSGSPVSPLPMIKFHQDGHEGIYLVDALHQRTAGFLGGNDRPDLTTTSSRVTLRINWAGYKEYAVAVNAREHSTSADSIPKWKLAYCIAKGVREFYQHAVPDGPDDARGGWTLQNIPFEKLLVAGLQHVSQGSWQPILIYKAA